jgi:hypothetical protein
MRTKKTSRTCDENPHYFLQKFLCLFLYIYGI